MIRMTMRGILPLFHLTAALCRGMTTLSNMTVCCRLAIPIFLPADSRTSPELPAPRTECGCEVGSSGVDTYSH